jgi:hypothetical protein
MTSKALQNYYPPLQERGMVELVGAKKPMCCLTYLITVGAASSYALVFLDEDGHPAEMADTNYVVHPHAEGTIAEVDESTKTTAGCTILSKDYAGSPTNFVNALNVTVLGRLKTQPALE